MMTLQDLEEALEEIFPNGFSIEADEEGQIVIFTHLMQDEDGDLVEFESDDEDEEDDEDLDDLEDSEEDFDDEDEW